MLSSLMTSLKGLVKFWMANARYDFLIKIVIKAYPSSFSRLVLFEVHPVGNFYCPQIRLAQRQSHIWARSLETDHTLLRIEDRSTRMRAHPDVWSESELRVRAPLSSFRDQHCSTMSCSNSRRNLEDRIQPLAGALMGLDHRCI